MIGDGLTAGEIAAELYLSTYTVRTHIKNAMRKLAARRVAHAAVIVALDEVGVRKAPRNLLAEVAV
jgi:DNA-binding CsgD family transcriptional regulator